MRCYKDGQNFFERIKGTTKGGEICKKFMQEGRLKLYEHVTRRDEDYVVNRLIMMDVDRSLN